MPAAGLAVPRRRIRWTQKRGPRLLWGEGGSKPGPVPCVAIYRSRTAADSREAERDEPLRITAPNEQQRRALLGSGLLESRHRRAHG
jgi:hypothetical protein